MVFASQTAPIQDERAPNAMSVCLGFRALTAIYVPTTDLRPPIASSARGGGGVPIATDALIIGRATTATNASSTPAHKLAKAMKSSRTASGGGGAGQKNDDMRGAFSESFRNF